MNISRERKYGDSLPERLQELRAIMHFSQADVAEQMHISRQTYSHYETGRIIPPADMLCQLADIFHVSVDALLGHKSSGISEQTNNSECDTAEYLRFINDPENQTRFQCLKECEKECLFYFTSLGKRDQQDLLDFMKIKRARSRNARPAKIE